MSGRSTRHSRKPSTGIPTHFLAEEGPDLKSTEQQPCHHDNTTNSNSPPPLPVSPPTPRQQRMNNKPPLPSTSVPDS